MDKYTAEGHCADTPREIVMVDVHGWAARCVPG